MPVQRFRSVEEMDAAPVVVPPGQGFERFARHCSRYWRVAPRVYPQGVYRFRTLAEAQAARDRVTQENLTRLSLPTRRGWHRRECARGADDGVDARGEAHPDGEAGDEKGPRGETLAREQAAGSGRSLYDFGPGSPRHEAPAADRGG